MPNDDFMLVSTVWSNIAINADVQRPRFALLLPAGYGERWTKPLRGRFNSPRRSPASLY